MAAETPQSTIENTDDFDLDVRIVVTGPAATALLSSTDNGCDTQKQGDC